MSSNGSCEQDVKVRIGKAAVVCGKMKGIWRNDNICPKERAVNKDQTYNGVHLG